MPSPPRSSAHPLRQIADGLIYVWRNKMVFGTITLDLGDQAQVWAASLRRLGGA